MGIPLVYKDKTYTGTYHWTELADEKFITVGGSRVSTLWNVPFNDMQQLGIAKLEFEDEIEILCQRQEYEPYRNGKTKLNHNNYQIVKLDFDFLLEWQARFFLMLGWQEEKARQFLSQDTLTYISERIILLRRREIDKQATILAETLGVPKEQILQQMLTIEPVKKDYLEGLLIRLANEYFISVGETKDLYKLNKPIAIEWLASNDYEEADWDGKGFDKYLNNKVQFKPDEKQKPPKSRNAKGWVGSIVSMEKV